MTPQDERLISAVDNVNQTLDALSMMKGNEMSPRARRDLSIIRDTYFRVGRDLTPNHPAALRFNAVRSMGRE